MTKNAGQERPKEWEITPLILHIDGENLALNRPATQSETYLDYYAWKAFDGNLGTIQATTENMPFWLRVELAGLSNITRVHIHTHGNFAINGGIITIARSSDMTQQAEQCETVNLNTGDSKSFACGAGIFGMYVRLSCNARLVLYEMKVIGETDCEAAGKKYKKHIVEKKNFVV